MVPIDEKFQFSASCCCNQSFKWLLLLLLHNARVNRNRPSHVYDSYLPVCTPCNHVKLSASCFHNNNSNSPAPLFGLEANKDTVLRATRNSAGCNMTPKWTLLFLLQMTFIASMTHTWQLLRSSIAMAI